MLTWCVMYGRHGEVKQGVPYEAFAKYGKMRASVSIVDGGIDIVIQLSKGDTEHDILEQAKVIGAGKGKDLFLKDFVKMDLKSRMVYDIKLWEYDEEVHKAKEWIEIENEGEGNYVEKGEILSLYPDKRMEKVEERYRKDDKGIWLKSVKYGNNAHWANYRNPLLILPAKFKLGYEDRCFYNIEWSDGTNTGHSFGIVTKRLRALEDVKISAGEVPSCLSVEIDYLHNYEGRISRENYKAWFHPDFGLVKSHNDSSYEKKERVLADIEPKGGKKKE